MKSARELPDCLIFSLFLIAGTLAFFHPTILSGFDLMQADPGDTRFNNYMLEHGFRWISGNPSHSSFWDLPIFYPAKNTAAYSDILLGAAPPYWLFRAIGLLPDTAFQMWMIAMGILNFSVAYLTMRKAVGLSALASAGGAYLFAFAALRANQMSHQQLLPQFFSMLAVYCLIRIVRNERFGEAGGPWETPGLIALFLASVVFQLYAGFYLGYFLCLGLSTWVATALLFREGRATIVAIGQRHAVAIALAFAVSLVPLSWMGYHYFQCKKHVGARHWSEVRDMVPRGESWLNMGPHSRLYGWTRKYVSFSWVPMEGEHRLGLGLLTLALTAIGLFRMARGTWGLIALIAALVLGLVAFRYLWSIMPWWIVFKIVPGAEAIRAVTRISLLLLIAFGFGLAFFLDSIRNRKIALGLLVLVCLEQAVTTPSYDKQVIRSEVARLASQIPADSKGFYYTPCFIPNGTARGWDQWPFKSHIDAMWAGLVAEVPTVNGYSGNMPPGWSKLENLCIRSKTDEERLRSALDQWLQAHGMKSDSVVLVGNRDCCSMRVDTFNCRRVHRMSCPSPGDSSGSRISRSPSLPAR